MRFGEDIFGDYLVNIGSALIFFLLSTTTSHLPDFSVRKVGSRPLTDGNAISRSFSPEFIVSFVMFRIGTIPV